MPETHHDHAGARAFVERCRRSETLILGIERVLLLGEGTWPDLSAIADWSGLSGGTGSASAQSHVLSLRFLDTYGQDPRERFIFVVEPLAANPSHEENGDG